MLNISARSGGRNGVWMSSINLVMCGGGALVHHDEGELSIVGG